MTTSTPTEEAPPLHRAGGLLFAGTFVGNLLNYGFFLVVSRRLSAGDLGAVGSMVNMITIATIPGLGAQLVAARLVATAGRRSPAQRRAAEGDILRIALVIGLILTIGLALASPIVSGLLHLGSPWPVIALALSGVPVTVTFAAQGILQGEERFAALATAYTVAGVSRFSAGFVGGLLGFGTTGIMLLVALGWTVTATVAYALLPRGARPHRAVPWRLAAQILAAALPAAGLLVLSNLDVLLARHHLSAEGSGTYLIGALFEKVAFWGPSFLATLYYPRMARPAEREAAIVRALGLTLGVGVAGVAVTWALGTPLVTIAGGQGYAVLGSHVWLWALLGVLLALVQVLVYADLAVGDHRVGMAVWLAAAGLVVGVSLRHADPVDVVGTVLWGVAALLGMAAILVFGRAARSVSRVVP